MFSFLSTFIPRTATNKYLVNIAFADLATLLLAMPNELYHIWRQYPWTFGEFVCQFKTVLQEAINHVSILTILGKDSNKTI